MTPKYLISFCFSPHYIHSNGVPLLCDLNGQRRHANRSHIRGMLFPTLGFYIVDDHHRDNQYTIYIKHIMQVPK